MIIALMDHGWSFRFLAPTRYPVLVLKATLPLTLRLRLAQLSTHIITCP
jgi:hypothetical protein